MSNVSKCKKYIWVILLLLIILVIVFILTNKNTMAIQTQDNITITCPAAVAAGQTIKCSITANINTITALSVDAYYDVTEGLEYKNFTTGNDWSNYASSANGFKLGNVNGVNGTSLVGTVEYTIPASSNLSQCTITLVDSKFSDSDYKMLYLGNTEVTVKILSGKENLPDDNSTSSSTVIASDERLPATDSKNNELSNNVKTGDFVIYMICFIGLMALGYVLFYYYSSLKK